LVLILSPEVARERLITDAYRKQQETLHENPDYGIASIAAAPLVSKLINQYGVDELLDYGAGKGNLARNLKVGHSVQVQHYDPAVPDWADTPEPSEMVACIDVLEHIEPALLDNVLDDLKRLTKRIGFFTVSTSPAEKTLPDGRNAHLIQETPEWWLPKIMERFELHVFQRTQDGFCVVVHSLPLEH
jgi:2-polyprenyl-3-methyl-5-hydroxy-6-metoxy-1,4-benzoquinol methylase